MLVRRAGKQKANAIRYSFRLPHSHHHVCARAHATPRTPLQETMEETGSESASGDHDKSLKRRRRYIEKRRTVVNPDENFHFYWLMLMTVCVLYNLWTLIVRQSFPELQVSATRCTGFECWG